MKTFKQHYTDTQFNNIINEQLTNNASEDVIVENIANIILKEWSSPPGVMPTPNSPNSGVALDPITAEDLGEVAGQTKEAVVKAVEILSNPAAWLRDKTLDAGKEVATDAAQGIVGAGLTVVAVKIVAKIIEKILAKSNAKADKQAAIADVEGESTFNDKVQDAIKRGDALTDDEKQQLANDISDKLTEKYPNRKKAWWLKALNAITKFLKGNGGAGLALLGYFLI